jgi:hypothetical protein
MPFEVYNAKKREHLKPTEQGLTLSRIEKIKTTKYKVICVKNGAEYTKILSEKAFREEEEELKRVFNNLTIED